VRTICYKKLPEDGQREVTAVPSTGFPVVRPVSESHPDKAPPRLGAVACVLRNPRSAEVSEIQLLDTKRAYGFRKSQGLRRCTVTSPAAAAAGCLSAAIGLPERTKPCWFLRYFMATRNMCTLSPTGAHVPPPTFLSRLLVRTRVVTDRNTVRGLLKKSRNSADLSAPPLLLLGRLHT